MRVHYNQSKATDDSWTSIAAAVICLHMLADVIAYVFVLLF